MCAIVCFWNIFPPYRILFWNVKMITQTCRRRMRWGKFEWEKNWNRSQHVFFFFTRSLHSSTVFARKKLVYSTQISPNTLAMFTWHQHPKQQQGRRLKNWVLGGSKIESRILLFSVTTQKVQQHFQIINRKDKLVLLLRNIKSVNYQLDWLMFKLSCCVDVEQNWSQKSQKSMNSTLVSELWVVREPVGSHFEIDNDDINWAFFNFQQTNFLWNLEFTHDLLILEITGASKNRKKMFRKEQEKV